MAGLMSEAEAFLRLLAAAAAGRLEGYAMPDMPALPGLAFAPWRGEALDAVLCLLCDDGHPLLYLDNLIGRCRDCRGRVQFRPTAPPGPRLCLICAAGRPAAMSRTTRKRAQACAAPTAIQQALIVSESGMYRLCFFARSNPAAPERGQDRGGSPALTDMSVAIDLPPYGADLPRIERVNWLPLWDRRARRRHDPPTRPHPPTGSLTRRRSKTNYVDHNINRVRPGGLPPAGDPGRRPPPDLITAVELGKRLPTRPDPRAAGR